MASILFIAAHRFDRSPGQRYRFEQYFHYFEKNGYTCELSYLISERADRYFYSPGNLHTKLYIFIKGIIKRLVDVLNANKYDIIFVQREAFMTGSTFFEKCFSKSKAKLVFDFDDAIWLLDVSNANKNLGWLKNPEKTAHIIKMADLVIAGNAYLANYAAKYNNNVVIIPTTIDTDKHVKTAPIAQNNAICIGWSGSITTIKHFSYAVPFLKKLKQQFGDKITIKVMGDSTYEHTELGIKGTPWSADTEVSELSTFDIGIMPLPDDEWAKGKCGLKGLSYMALEVPTIMSPVGVNTEIIQEGVNGFLASTEAEWIEKIAILIDAPELRKEIGKNARKTVIERYSVLAHRDNYINYFNQLLRQ